MGKAKEMSYFPKPRRTDLNEHTTPIWTAESGYRLSVVRERFGMTQAELAKDLGTAQSIISRIEAGHLAVPKKPFSVKRLLGVFPRDTAFIILSHNESKYPWAAAELHRRRIQNDRQNRSNDKEESEAIRK